jgi:hypothetical protein
LAVCTPAWGTAVSYTVDTAQSTLNLSGSWNGLTLWHRPAGSLATSYSGSIQADLTDTSIHLLDANLDADSSGSYRPRFDGRGGRQAGDYGGFFRLGAHGLRGNLNTAFRDVVLDLASAPMLLSGGAFDAALATVTAASGAMDYAGAGLLRPVIGQGRAPITGVDVANATEASGLLALTNGIETLTLPINATFAVNLDSGIADEYDAFQLTLTGTIVASRESGDAGRGEPDLPEPATLSFLAVGFSVIWMRRRRAS